jgi:hypothetical protein
MSEAINRATRVQRLMEDADLIQAFQDVRDALHGKFEQTLVNDGDTLLDIRKMLHLLDSVWANLERAVEDGQLEEANIEEVERYKVASLGDKKWQRTPLKR